MSHKHKIVYTKIRLMYKCSKTKNQKFQENPNLEGPKFIVPKYKIFKRQNPELQKVPI